MPRKPNPKLTPAAVEATAAAFLAAFKALPAKVKNRFVELLDDYEDEVDWQQYEADKAANPDDYAPENSITIQEYVAQQERRAQKGTDKNATSQPLAA